MHLSHTQMSHYLGCPRRYRYRYLDGWEETAMRAPLLFGRAFEQALAAHFRGESASTAFAVLWENHCGDPLDYGAGDSWQKCADDGQRLLEIFIAEQRVEIPLPSESLQVRYERRLGANDYFEAYIDAVGLLDGTRSILDWKTTSAAYPSSPAGLVALDPQMICYSWITGIAKVALVVFVRKRTPEIQYLCATISERQRSEYGCAVESALAGIRQGRFEPRPGIRFPQNGCLSCAYLGLCLGRPELVEGRIQQKSDTVWLDHLGSRAA